MLSGHHPVIEGTASSAADALLVAGLLGLVVEYPLKRRFAEEIARDTFLTLFDVKAPQDYTIALGNVCRTDHLCPSMTWEIVINWLDKPDSVQVEITSRRSVRNIGLTPAALQSVWLMPSSKGLPQSYFQSYTAEIQGPDDKVERLETLKQDALAELATPAGNFLRSGLAIPADSLYGKKVVPPGATFASTTVGVVHLGVPGMVPLVMRYPAMRVDFILEGNALEELNVHVASAFGSVPQSGPPSGEEGPLDRPGVQRYLVQSLSLPGSTYRLEFVLKESDTAEDGESEDADDILEAVA